MGMSEGERWALVCEPTLKRIEGKVDKLTETVITGNGKPSLVTRMENVERGISDAKTGQRSRSVKIGPLELNGYAISDVLKVGIFCALVWGAWLIVTDRQERLDTLKEIRQNRHAGDLSVTR